MPVYDDGRGLSDTLAKATQHDFRLVKRKDLDLGFGRQSRQVLPDTATGFTLRMHDDADDIPCVSATTFCIAVGQIIPGWTSRQQEVEHVLTVNMRQLHLKALPVSGILQYSACAIP